MQLAHPFVPIPPPPPQKDERNENKCNTAGEGPY